MNQLEKFDMDNPPTIEHIAEMVMDSNPKYFSENTLDFFSQCFDDFFDDFNVEVSPTGRLFFYAELTRPPDSRIREKTRVGCGYSFKEVVWDKDENRWTLETPYYGGTGEDWKPVQGNNIREIATFIATH
jgi:hypothetical protein